MTRPTVCPLCQEKVGVPETTHETALVKCPLCEEDFILGDGLPSDLPEVTIVDPGRVDDRDVVVGDVAASALDDTGTAAAATETTTETASATAARPKKKRKGPGLVGNAIGIVLFGIVGLGLGYGILWLIDPAKTAPIDRFVSSFLPSGGSEQSSNENDFIPGQLLEIHDKAQLVNRAMFSTLLGEHRAGNPFEVTPDQLSPSLAAAAEAVRAEEVDIGAAYVALCDAGNKMTYLVSSDQNEELQGIAKSVMRDFAAQDRKKKIFNAINWWLKIEDRPEEYRQMDGIFLIGVVKRVGACGDVFCSEIQFKKSRSLLVISNTQPEFSEGDQAAILGSLVRDPEDEFPGIKGLTEALDKFDADSSTIMLGAFGFKL